MLRKVKMLYITAEVTEKIMGTNEKARIRKAQIKRNRIIIVGIVLIGLICAAFGYFGRSDNGVIDTTGEGIMRVTFLDVGQGDCEFIECDGVNILIDGGEAANADFVLTFLKSRGVTKLDYYFVSHPHSDHMGAASVIIDSIPVDRFVTTDFSELNMPTSKVYENMLDSLERQPECDVVTVKAGDAFEIGKLRLNVLAPFEETSDYNNMSIVLRVDYGDTRFLFTGDAEKSVEKQMLDSGSDVKANVLKVAHHGSKTSTGAEFLKAVSPELAVISCGAGNSYGHPHKETTELLERCSITYFRTDQDGTVTVYSDGKQVSAQKNAA